MKCKRPYMKGLLPCSCGGHCKPCKINIRRLWTHRIMLESKVHKSSSFFTLTYDDAHLPPGQTLNPKDVQDFLKRLRKSISPSRVRFYLVGEYGTTTQRPHYHGVLFGYPPCMYGQTNLRIQSCCENCSTITKAWGNGSIHLAQLTEKSAQYVAGYVMKKFKEESCPKDKYPEFSRMSLKPGIGALAMSVVAQPIIAIQKELNQSYLDVPATLQSGRRPMPLGRYLRSKLREELGRSRETPLAVKVAYIAEVCRLHEGYQETSSFKESPFKTPRDRYFGMNKQLLRNQDSKIKIYEQRKVKL